MSKDGLSEFEVGQTFVASSRMAASLFSIPPLGGKENRLSQRRRYYHVIQIMFLALMGFSAAIVTIAGIVHLFSK